MIEQLFISVLNMSLISGYAIVFVLIARLLLKKAPKIFSYALWGIVLFRLLCPVSFESVLSFMPARKSPIQHDIINSPSPQISTGMSILDNAINPVLPIPNMGDSVNPIRIWIFIGALIWIVGMLAMLIYSIIAFVKLKRNLIGSVRLKENIYLADHINSPFVMGLFKPKIYLPSSLSEGEKDFVIAHEMCHIGRFDHLTRILGFAALTVHWFNPLAWAAFVASGKDMELSCDEAVMKKMNGDIRAEYSQSLLRFGTSKKMIYATPLAFGEGDTKKRVKNVLNYKKPAFWVIIISVAAIVAVGLGLATNQVETKTIQDGTYSMVVQGDASGGNVSIEDGKFVFCYDLLSSYWPKGNYEIKGDILTLSTDDGKNKYIFTIDGDALIFKERGSSDVKLTDDRLGVQVVNGSVFRFNGELPNDLRPMIMVDDVLYLDTGKEVDGNVDDSSILGEITSVDLASEKPTKNGQCNFNRGLGAKYAVYEDGMAVFLNNKWFFFEKEINLADPPEKLTHDQAVASALFSWGDNFRMEECISEGHIILGYDDSDKDKTKIYALTQIGVYGFENNNFVEVGGSAFPAVITLFSDNHVEIEQPLDGDGYGESIKEMFPEEYHDKIFKETDADRDNLRQQQEKYASEYLAKIGRDAKIGAYSDFEYTYPTDEGVSVEASNNLQFFYKAHNYYPSFIGTCERLENGLRMVYEMSYTKNQDEIVFSKYNYDTKQILEKFTADAKTGDIVG